MYSAGHVGEGGSSPKGDDEWGTAAPNLHRRGEPERTCATCASRHAGAMLNWVRLLFANPKMFAAQRPVCAQEKRAREDSESMSE